MNRLFLIVALSVLVLTGCQYSNYTYIQTPLNVPQLEKKGDTQVDLYGSVRGVDVQSSYALSNRIALMVNGNGAVNTFGVDAGVGYYKVKNKFTYALYTGIGIGDIGVKSSSSGPPYFSNASYEWDNSSHYQKMFIQSSLTKKVGERFSYTFALRASYARFDSYAYKHREKSGPDERKLNEYIDTVETRSPAAAIIIDPVVKFCILPEKRFSFHAQIGYSFGIALGDLTESRPINMNGYTSSGLYVAHSYAATSVAHPVFFPLSIYGGIRFKIKK